MFNEFYHIDEKNSRAAKIDKDKREKRRTRHNRQSIKKSTNMIPHDSMQGVRRYA